MKRAAPLRVLFAADDWHLWEAPLRAECPEVEFTLSAPPDSVDAILYAQGGPGCDFAAYPSARLVQSLWAGVERIAPDPSLTQPLARMVDPGLAQGMSEYCLGWALRLHLGMDNYAQDGVWRNDCLPVLATDRKISVLGAGVLGKAVAQALRQAGFAVATWSNSGRGVPGIEAFAGQDLHAALRRADIVISLLPDTPDTRGLLNARAFDLMPCGAALINAGRGTVIDDDDLLQALANNQLSRAVLDVFHVEPLPPDHPFWGHDKITVTPHISAATRPESAAKIVAGNLRRVMAGEPPLYLVDRQRGY